MTRKALLVFVVLGSLLLSEGGRVHPSAASQACAQPTKLVLVRHGQTDWNARGLLQGNAEVPLDETGRAQARSLAHAVAGKRVDAVYSSPLSRAYETALAIAEARGLAVGRRAELREIGVGIYTGLRLDRIPADVRTAWSANPDFPMPTGVPEATASAEPAYVEGRRFEGESLNMVLERSWRDLRDLGRQHCGQTVVVVTHGGVIQIALTQASGLAVTRYRAFPVSNASQTILEYRSDGSVAVLPDW